MKKLLILLFSLGVLMQVNAQELTDAMLFGDVKCVSTKEHIPYATIYVKGTNIGTMSDGSGHYKLANLPLGKQIIVAQTLGYKTQELEVFMEKGKGIKLFFELEEDALNLSQVVVTGTRSKHHLKDVPVRTEIITRQQIETKNASNIYEALDGIPGIRVESQCSGCHFTMARMQGLGSEHTQILINGQPAFSGLASVYGLQQIATTDIEQIEVIKGAGSALYGSSAVAGAINIVTKEPSFIPSTNLDLQFGTYNTNRFNISSSMRNEKGNIGLQMYAQKISEGTIDETTEGTNSKEIREADGIADRVGRNLTNAGFGFFVNDALMKNDKLTIRGTTIFERREGGVIEDDAIKNPFFEGVEVINTDRYEAHLNYNKKIHTESDINFSMSFVNHKRDATNDIFLVDYMETNNNDMPPIDIMRPFLANENSYISTLTYGKKINNHSLLVGIQAYQSILEESGMYVVVDESSLNVGKPYRSISNKSATELGAFIQDEWKVNQQFTIVPGVRIDNHNSKEEYFAESSDFQANIFPKTSFNQSVVNPRLALKYKISNKFTVRANTGTGFRAPYGFNEDLHLCSGSPRVWKSTDLEAETSMSYNVSGDYYGRNVRFSLNVFRTDLKNKIDFAEADSDIAALGYSYIWENIDDAFVQGIEFSTQTKITRNFSFGIDVTLNQGEYKNVRDDWANTDYANISKNISRFPKQTGNLRLEYTPRTWSIALYGNYQGNMYIDYYNEDIDPIIGDISKIKKTDPFMTFNARLSKKLNNFRLYAGINNIFNYIQDERYLDDPAFLYAPIYGTTIYGGVSINITH